jgi:hypothetical protein
VARQYRRDSRGRFASGSSSTVRGNFRPRNTMARPTAQRSGYGKNPEANIERFIRDAQATGRFRPRVRRVADKGNIADVQTWNGKSQLSINSRSKWFRDPVREQRQLRRSGHFSTSDPRGLLAHEAAHARFRHSGNTLWPLGLSNESKRIARRVSRYATTNPMEFVAEVVAGRKTGRKYDSEVMSTYRAAAGLPKLRTGSRVKPGGKPQANPRAVSRDRKRRRRG